MNDFSHHQPAPQSKPGQLSLSLLLSLVLHLVLILAVIRLADQPPPPQTTTATRVRLVERPAVKQPQPTKPEQIKTGEFEIDERPQQPPPKKSVEAKRQATHDQQVVREQAPKGDDVRDQQAQAARQSKAPAPASRAQTAQQATPRQPRTEHSNKAQTKTVPLAPTTATAVKKQQPVTETASAPPQLSADQLRPGAETLARIARGAQAQQERIKQRDAVEQGDTVWLNLQSNQLASFFRRFHDQIEMVWNYPPEAAAAGVEGTLLLSIKIDPQGELIDVDLKRSSGSDVLDFEAIQAVYRAAPFGPLSRHYPHETLTIRAHFSYNIVGRYIYGERK